MLVELACAEKHAKGNRTSEVVMESKFVLDLEEWIKTKGLKKSDANVAAFMAVRDQVKARLDQGYSAAIIHEYLPEGQRVLRGILDVLIMSMTAQPDLHERKG